MPFAIVEYRSELTTVPEKWLIADSSGNTQVYWPPARAISALQKRENTEPVLSGDDEWIPGPEIVKRTGIATFELAEKDLTRMEQYSTTETESSGNEGGIVTRAASASKVHQASSQKPKTPIFTIPSHLQLGSAPSQIGNTKAARKLNFTEQIIPPQQLDEQKNAQQQQSVEAGLNIRLTDSPRTYTIDELRDAEILSDSSIGAAGGSTALLSGMNIAPQAQQQKVVQVYQNEIGVRARVDQ